MSQNTFLSDVLGSAPLSEGKLAYFRARFSNALHQLVLDKFVELEGSKFTRADLARKIGRKPEQVTRWLGSPGNWTLETVSDLLLGMGCELSASIVDFKIQQMEADAKKVRKLAPAGKPAVATDQQASSPVRKRSTR